MAPEERRLRNAIKRLKQLRDRATKADQNAIDVGIEHIEARLTDKSLETVYGDDAES
jgi:hypothetical protein